MGGFENAQKHQEKILEDEILIKELKEKKERMEQEKHDRLFNYRPSNEDTEEDELDTSENELSPKEIKKNKKSEPKPFFYSIQSGIKKNIKRNGGEVRVPRKINKDLIDAKNQK